MRRASLCFFIPSVPPGHEGTGTRRALRYGLAAAAGMITVAIALAVVILIAGVTFAPSLRVVTTTPNPYTRAVRMGAGLLLVVLGVLQWRGTPFAPGLRSHLGGGAPAGIPTDGHAQGTNLSLLPVRTSVRAGRRERL